MKLIPRAQARKITPVHIACINKATVDLGVPMAMLTRALQKAYDEHFLPIWGYPVKLYNTQKPRPGDWCLYYLDDARDDDCYGLHDLTHRGQPMAKVFVRDTQADGGHISVVASHEIFEMAIDPLANLWAQATQRTLYAYEMCDPVEEDFFPVDGFQISNFVYPTWFEAFHHPKGTQFDHMGLLKKPFSKRASGYVIIKRNGRVKEIWGSKAKKKRFLGEDRWDHRSEFRKGRGHGLLTKYRKWKAK